MSESASSDNPEAGQANEVKNGESNAEGTKEPGGSVFFWAPIGAQGMLMLVRLSVRHKVLQSSQSSSF